jgi:hypothetical protein
MDCRQQHHLRRKFRITFFSSSGPSPTDGGKLDFKLETIFQRYCRAQRTVFDSSHEGKWKKAQSFSQNTKKSENVYLYTQISCMLGASFLAYVQAIYCRLNMELDLQSLLWLLCTAVLYSLAETSQLLPPSPRIWAHLRGRYLSAKMDDISL